MRLSDAIRKGATLHPQGFGRLLSRGLDGGIRTCALGAAAVAVTDGAFATAAHTAAYGEIFRRHWRHLGDALTPRACPLGCQRMSAKPLSEIVVHLNDAHLWTREAIADWVATIEAAIEAMPIEAVEPELVAV